MGEENGTAASLRRETAQDVLPEGVVGAALRRCAIEVTSPRIRGECVAIPLLDGVRRISQNDVKTHETVTLHELRFREGVAADDLKVLDAVQETVHPRDG